MAPSHTVREPAVSVIIPAYQASGDIAEALSSVFAQTFTSFEVIVINDGSPDTAELEAAIEPFRDRIRYFVQPNRGAGAARNAGIRAARGRYVALLDADDLWFPDFLRRQTSLLAAHPGCGLVYCDAIISGDSVLAGRRFMDTAPSCGEVTLHSLISQQCNIALSTVVARRSAIVDAGLFDEGLRRGQDFDLWLRLALRGVGMCYQESVLAERRVRASGLSGDSLAQIQRALHVLDRFGRANHLGHEARSAVRARMVALIDRLEIEHAKQRMVEGNFAAARYHLTIARERPWKLRLALMGLLVSPRLMRAAYLRMRPSAWKNAAVALN